MPRTSLSQRPKLVFIYKTLGPYHLPRLIHLAKETASFADVRCIVIASRQNDYAWSTEQNLIVKALDSLSIVTLFPNKSVEKVSAVQQFRALIKDMKIHRPSLILTAGYSHLPMLFSALVMRGLGVPTALMSDSNQFDRPRSHRSEFLKGFVLKAFDGALAAGHHSRNYLADLGMRADLIETACDVVDNEYAAHHAETARRSTKDNPSCFLFVGRMVEEKNIPLLLQAYQIYRDQCTETVVKKLVICGSGPLEDNVKARVAEMGLIDVDFAGYVLHPDIYFYYAQACALVLSSKQETWGLVVNEALAAGLPVMVSDACGCAPDLVLEGCTGWTFPSDDANELANLMLEADQLSAVQYLEMQSSCRQHISQWGLPKFTSGCLRLAGRIAGFGPYAGDI